MFPLVMCRLRLQAVGQAEPGLCGPGQAGPYFRPHPAFGPALYYEKPEPRAQAAAFRHKMFLKYLHEEVAFYLCAL